MILKYDEALKRAENKDWFEAFYKKEDIASDEVVDKINSLVKEIGEQYLFDYFSIEEDMIIQKEYVDDLMEYLLSI